MAVYIDKNKLKKKKKYLFQTKGMPFPKSEYFIKMDDVFDMPPANVVERQKVDKAIEEIENINQLAQYTRGDIKRMCIEIIKKNIGE